MDSPPRITESLRAFTLSALVGLRTEDARLAVESAGGRLRVTGRGEPLHADYRTNRVTVVAEQGLVVEVLGIG